MNKEIKFVDSWDLCLEVGMRRKKFNETIRRIKNNKSYSGIILENIHKDIRGTSYISYLLDYRTMCTLSCIMRKYKEGIIAYTQDYFKGYTPTYIEEISEFEITRELRTRLYEAGVKNEEEATQYILDNYDKLYEYLPNEYKRKYSDDVAEESYELIREEYDNEDDEYDDYLYED